MSAIATKKKRKKTREDREMLWFLVNDVLRDAPRTSQAEMRDKVQERYNVEAPAWLISEARYIHGQKVKRGEFPPAGGYEDIEHVKKKFLGLSIHDRIRFADWAQFTVTRN